MRKGDRITFVDEIIAAVDAFLDDYERERGPLAGPMERGLVASYILGVFRMNVDALWDGLASSSVFGHTDPRALFAQRAARNGVPDQALLDEVNDALRARGWGR